MTTPAIHFIGLGAARSGTTWLANCLAAHPAICLSEPKEVHYFNRRFAVRRGIADINNPNATKPLSWYLGHFQHAQPHQLAGEFSTAYLCDVDAPQRIRAQCPEAKLLVCLRNPIDRAYSHYWFNRGVYGREPRPFEEAIRVQRFYIEMGCYADQLERYLEWCAREQLHVVLFDDIPDHPEEVVQRTLRFLGIDRPLPSEVIRSRFTNPARLVRSQGLTRFMSWGARAMRDLQLTPLLNRLRRVGIHRATATMNSTPFRYPEMDPATRQHLRAIFHESNSRLEALVGRDLSHWT